MAIELAIQSDGIDIGRHSEHLEKVLNKIFSGLTVPKIAVENINQEEQHVRLKDRSGSVQLLKFSIPDTANKHLESYLNIAVIERSSASIILMVSVAITIAQVENTYILDDAKLFGKMEHYPDSLLLSMSVDSDKTDLEEFSKAICQKFNLF